MQNMSGKVIYTANVGDAVKFRCGPVNGVTQYEFRVITPGLQIVNLAATGNFSSDYRIQDFGRFRAQCRLCPNGVCQEWEPVPGLTGRQILPVLSSDDTIKDAAATDVQELDIMLR